MSYMKNIAQEIIEYKMEKREIDDNIVYFLNLSDDDYKAYVTIAEDYCVRWSVTHLDEGGAQTWDGTAEDVTDAIREINELFNDSSI